MKGKVWTREGMSDRRNQSSIFLPTTWTEGRGRAEAGKHAHIRTADHRWKTCRRSCETPVSIPTKLTFVANTLCKAGQGKFCVEDNATHIMKGMIAMAIQPLRVAMGMLWPMAMFGQ